jgi:enoyl-CoA hydratase
VTELLRLHEEATHTVVTLDDGKANALSLPVWQALDGALDAAAARRVPVVLAGRPGIFSAGFDLKVMTGDDPVAREDMVSVGFEVVHRLLGLPVPLVVACTGHAIAMGAFLLCAGDRRIGAAGAFRIGANETALGIVMPQFAIELTRGRLTPAAHDRALLTGELFGPEVAAAIGFLDEVVPADEVVDRAGTTAATLGALDPDVYARTKQRVRGPGLARLRAAIDSDAADRHRPS